MQEKNIESINQARAQMIKYTYTTITLPPDPDIEYSECCPYNLELHTYEMIVAGDSGLAYVEMDNATGTSYTVVHLPSGKFLNVGWSVETEALAQRWIEWLLQLADWQEPEPQFRPGKWFEAVTLMCEGMLTRSSRV